MQKEPKQKRFEVRDEKLDKLIGKYGMAVLMCSHEVEISGQDYKKYQDERKQAMQAIIDYHDKKIQEATKYIREIWEKYEFGRLHIAPYNEILMVLRDVKQAIKKDLEGK